MSLRILILTLLLSKVVHETDSCSSFTGWKLRSIDVEHKEQIIQIEMTTIKMIDIDTNHKIKNISRMHRIITEPLILQDGKGTVERCEADFEQAFCHSHGKCYEIKDSKSLNNEERFCECDLGYGDKHCTNKLPDGEYRTIKDRTDINKKLPVNQKEPDIEKMQTETIILRTSTERSISNENHVGHIIPCPEPYIQDLCINGKCFMFSGLTESYFCVCHDNFTGNRCDTKVPDYYYETRRSRRDLRGFRKRKYKTNQTYRQLT